MDTQNKRGEGAARQELLDELRRLARWKNNDVVKLAFLDGEEADGVDALDLSGVVELRRNANGTFEAKFVDKVRVLAMLREVLDRPNAPLLDVVRREAVEELLADPDHGAGSPWYGQLMARPQTIAYLVQVNHWLEHYHIELV